MVVPACSVAVDVLIVEAVIGSLKSAVMVVLMEMPVALAAGDCALTTGGNTSIGRRAIRVPPFLTEALRVTVPFPVAPMAARVPQAAPTETRFVVCWISYSSVSAPGELLVRQVASVQVTLEPPVEPTAWPR